MTWAAPPMLPAMSSLIVDLSMVYQVRVQGKRRDLR